DAPRLGLDVVNFHLVVQQVESNVGHVQEIVREIFLYQIALVAKADDEFGQTMGTEDFHDVPEDWSAANLDHRLWLGRRLLGQSASDAAGEEHHLYRGSHVIRLFESGLFVAQRFRPGASTYSAIAGDALESQNAPAACQLDARRCYKILLRCIAPIAAPA